MIFHRRYQRLLPPYLYGDIRPREAALLEKHLDVCAECRSELDQLRKLHALASGAPLLEPDAEFLRDARMRFRQSLVGERRPGLTTRAAAFFDSAIRGITVPRPALVLGSAALILAGAIGGRVLFPARTTSQATPAEAAGIEGVRLANMQQVGGEGQEVELTFDAVRPVRLKGKLESPEIQRILAYAVVNSDNPGVRLRAIGSAAVTPSPAQDREMKAALLLALRTDKNDGVRKEALQALLRYPPDREVRNALVYVLLNDVNPGLRIAAINGLDTLRERGLAPDHELIETFKDRIQHDDNLYIQAKAKTIIGVKQQ
jgi:anti-sigma factor RsiW